MWAFFNMLQAVDAFFPVGAFTLSNGLETYVQQEVFQTPEDLDRYLEDYLRLLPENDLGFMYLGWKFRENKQMLCRLDWLASAAKPAKEIREGSQKVALRFLKAVEKMDGGLNGHLYWYYEEIKKKRMDGCHPIVLGLYAGEMAMDIKTALGMYGYSILSAIVNNAVKLVPLSQMEGQRILNRHLPQLQEAVERTLQIDMDKIGISGCAWDIRCLQHQWLYARLYMS